MIFTKYAQQKKSKKDFNLLYMDKFDDTAVYEKLHIF